MADDPSTTSTVTDDDTDEDEDDEPKGKAPVSKADDGVPPAVKAALRKANKEAETLRLKLKEFEDRDKTETQKLAERADAAEKRAAELERQTLRSKVGAAKGLPPKMWDRLRGDDEDALKADADDLLAEIKPNGRAPSFDGGAKGRTAPAETDMNAVLKGAFRRT